MALFNFGHFFSSYIFFRGKHNIGRRHSVFQTQFLVSVITVVQILGEVWLGDEVSKFLV